MFGWGSRCILSNPSTLSLQLGTSFSTDIFYNNLTIRGGVLLKLENNESVPALAISLPLPPVLPIPKVILKAPLQHTLCSPLVLDASASMDSQGTVAIVWSCFSGCNQEIQNVLNEAFTSIVIIPAKFLENGQILQIRLDITNIWGITSFTNETVTITDKSSLYVDVIGADKAILLSEYAVPVIASVSVLECDGTLAELPTGKQAEISVEWRLFGADGTLISELQGPAFIIEPGLLASYLSVAKPLNLTLTASASGYVDATKFISISKARALSVPSVLLIQPLGTRLSLTQSVNLTAVAYPKALFRRENVTYICSWRCFMITGQVSPDDLRGSQSNLSECEHVDVLESNTSSVLLIPRDLGFAEGREYVIATSCIVSISNEFSSRELTAMASVFVEPKLSPSTAIFPLHLNLISFDSGTGMYLVDIRSPPLFCSQWPSLEDDTITWTISQRNGSYFSDLREQEVLVDTNVPNGIIEFKAGALSQSTVYSVRLTTSRRFKNGTMLFRNSTSTFIFTTGSTFGGAILVASPQSGVAFDTVFKLCVPEFSAVTIDGLLFRFGFSGVRGDSVFRDGMLISEPCASAVLPPGNVTLWADIVSTYGDVLRVSTSVLVAESRQSTSFNDILSRLEGVSADQELRSALTAALISELDSADSWISQDMIELLLNDTSQGLGSEMATLKVSDVLSSRMKAVEQIVGAFLALAEDSSAAACKTAAQRAADIATKALNAADPFSISITSLRSALNIFSKLSNNELLQANGSVIYDLIGTVFASGNQVAQFVSAATALGDDDALIARAGVLPKLPSTWNLTGAQSINVSTSDGSVFVFIIQGTLSEPTFPLDSSKHQERTASLSSLDSTQTSVMKVTYRHNESEADSGLVLQVWKKCQIASSNVSFFSPIVAVKPILCSAGCQNVSNISMVAVDFNMSIPEDFVIVPRHPSENVSSGTVTTVGAVTPAADALKLALSSENGSTTSDFGKVSNGNTSGYVGSGHRAFLEAQQLQCMTTRSESEIKWDAGACSTFLIGGGIRCECSGGGPVGLANLPVGSANLFSNANVPAPRSTQKEMLTVVILQFTFSSISDPNKFDSNLQVVLKEAIVAGLLPFAELTIENIDIISICTADNKSCTVPIRYRLLANQVIVKTAVETSANTATIVSTSSMLPAFTASFLTSWNTASSIKLTAADFSVSIVGAAQPGVLTDPHVSMTFKASNITIPAAHFGSAAVFLHINMLGFWLISSSLAMLISWGW